MTQNQAGTVGSEISAEQAQSIAGGECTVGEYLRAVSDFKQAYEDLIEFTSYVIERVAGP